MPMYFIGRPGQSNDRIDRKPNCTPTTNDLNHQNHAPPPKHTSRRKLSEPTRNSHARDNPIGENMQPQRPARQSFRNTPSSQMQLPKAG